MFTESRYPDTAFSVPERSQRLGLSGVVYSLPDRDTLSDPCSWITRMSSK